MLWAGVVGSGLFVVVFVVDGATRPGYRWRYHPVSALALGPRGWVQTANFLVCGGLVTVGAVGLQGATGLWFLPIVVGVVGVGLVLSGLFPMDPMRGYPPGTADGDPATFSQAHAWHDHAGAVVFGGLPIAAASAAIRLDTPMWQVASAVVAVALAVLAGLFASAWEQDRPRTGLVQRAYLVGGCGWLGALCWSLT